MRISARPLLFLVTATATVSAAPGPEETTGRISYRGAPARPPAGSHDEPAPPSTGWIELASATPASHGRELIEVDAGTAALTQLRLTVASGRPGIRAVGVDFADGGHRTFEVEKVLAAGRRPAYVDLHGARAVRQIVVVTDRDSRGSYTVEGNPADGTVATR